MKIYKFHFRIDKRAGLGNTPDHPQPSYMEVSYEAKKKLSNKEKTELIQRFRKDLAEQMGLKMWQLTPISQKEYVKHLEG